MTARSLTRRWPLALLAGVLVGVALAVLIPRTHAEAPTPASPTIAPARAPGTNDTQMPPVAGTVRIVRRTADPDGGPDWAIRTYIPLPRLDAASRNLPAREVRRREADLRNKRCAQLGRIVDGRFGWIDAVNVFRPAGFSFTAAPTQCQRGPALRLTTLITDPTQPSATVRQQVAWGVGGAPNAAVTLRTPGAQTSVPTGAAGTWLAFVDRNVQARQVRATVPKVGGGSTTIPRISRQPQLPPPFKTWKIRPAVADAPVVVQARAPDPDGALPYGVPGVPAQGGGWCTGEVNRIVGDRVGPVNAWLGTLEEYGAGVGGRCPGIGGPRAAKRAVDLGYSYGGDTGDPQHDELGDGQVARRTLNGRTMFYGTARADVRTLTFSTPRDERTIAPSGPAHAFLVVYDGTFPTGTTVVTARFADGSSNVVERIGPMSGP